MISPTEPRAAVILALERSLCHTSIDSVKIFMTKKKNNNNKSDRDERKSHM